MTTYQCQKHAQVGNDAFGDQQVENFVQNEIDSGAVLRTSDVPTGVAQASLALSAAHARASLVGTPRVEPEKPHCF